MNSIASTSYITLLFYAICLPKLIRGYYGKRKDNQKIPKKSVSYYLDMCNNYRNVNKIKFRIVEFKL